MGVFHTTSQWLCTNENPLPPWAHERGKDWNKGMLDGDFKECLDNLLTQRAHPSPSILPLFTLPWPSRELGPSVFRTSLRVEQGYGANMLSQTRHHSNCG